MQIGRYETERELGRGGMGIVYAARDPEGRPVALKLIKPGGGTGARERRFVREVEALTRLRHEGVVRILDAGDHHGWSYLVTELVDGESLEERLARDGALEPGRAARVARDVARAVAHAHAHDVLHRDLKPSNVLIDGEGRARVIDFGLTRDATSAGSLTQSGQLLGTPGFWSPEQARGERGAVGKHSDVYGVGAVLYAALTRDPPATGDTLQELLIATCDRLPTPASSVRPEVDRGLDAICLRALAKAPAERWPSAEALADALDGWLAGRGDAPATADRRRRVAVAVAVVAALAAVAGGGALLATRPLGGAGVEPPPAAVTATPVAATEPPPPEVEPPGARVAALTSRGLERLRAGDLVAAGVAFDEALAADPVNVAALAGRARVKTEQGDVEAGRREAARAVELDPTSADAWFARGDALASGDPPDEDAAMAAFERALELDPEHAEALAARGWFRFNVGDFGTPEQALDDMTRSLARRPDAWTHVQRGMVNSHLGRREAAMADFAAALALEPLAAAHYERARLLGEEGRTDEALADLDRAIELDPLPSYFQERSLVREERGDLAGARQDRERATTEAEQTPYMLVRLGDARMADGDLKGAEEAYTRLIKRFPDDPTGWFARGSLRTQQGDHMNARVDFDQAIARAPGDPRGWFGRGNLRWATKDVDGALADWARAADLDPENPWPPHNRAGALRERGELQAALAEYDRALARWPEMAEALAGRGLVKRDQGELDAAVSDLSMARDLLPVDAPARAEVERLLEEVKALRNP